MDDKEFRKLRREDLIEIIYQYQRREQRLTQENETLKSQLKDRNLQMEKAGSIAQAALALNGVFEAAQQAADQYLQSVRFMAESGKAAPASRKPEEKQLRPEKEVRPPAPEPQKPVQPAEKPAVQIPADPGKAASSLKPPAPASKPVVQKPAAAKPQPPQAKKPAVPATQQQKPPVPQNRQPAQEGNDTDAFIASLKDYLGM